MSKRKMIIIGLIVILLLVSLVLILTFSNKKNETISLYGEYSEVVTENMDIAYQKSYLMMDCCEEWPDLYKDMIQINNLTAAEGYEIYLYDKNGKRTDGENIITFIPTEDFKTNTQSLEGRYDLYHWTEGGGLELILQDSKDFKVDTKQQGIFVIAYIGQEKIEKPFVSNPECTGQCRACE